ncbi:MAG: phage terminase small subunit-related protein [Thermodesulfobacteriota bacterium]
MKREARKEAESIFLASEGKISNTEIAKKVGANAITVGKWKRKDDWESKLASARPTMPTPVRKKDAYEKALKYYLEAKGQIANAALAEKVKVSAATISKWKGSEEWADKLKEQTEAKAVEPEEAEPVEEEVEAVAQADWEEEPDVIEIDVDELTRPSHITLLNQRIDDMLGRDHLSPIDLRTTAEAKEAVLRAIIAYIDVLERASED